MTTVDAVRDSLAAGRAQELAVQLASVEPSERRTVSKPLVGQASAMLSARFSSTVTSWLRDLRYDYPGGHEQFVDAWDGRLTQGHWDAATTVLLGSKTPSQAARVWPIPGDRAFAQWVYPLLFSDELTVFVTQWSTDFATNPKNWDRNGGRAVMYEWIEGGLVDPPHHDGAVLMLIGGFTAEPGRPLLRWLLARPKVTSEVFTRIFTTPGVNGASLAQRDQSHGDDSPLRTVVVPGLVKAGVWSRDFVAESARTALSSDLPAYQRRWFARLADDFVLTYDRRLADAAVSVGLDVIAPGAQSAT